MAENGTVTLRSILASNGIEVLEAGRNLAKFRIIRSDQGASANADVLTSILKGLKGEILGEEETAAGLEVSAKFSQDIFELLMATEAPGAIRTVSLDHCLLKRALATISTDGTSWWWSGAFVDLLAETSILAKSEKMHTALYGSLDSAYQDISNMLVLVQRLEWQRGLYLAGQLDDGYWYHYSVCDIDLFHVQFRSLFDHIATAINHGAVKPCQNGESFSALYTDVTGPHSERHRGSLGDELADIVGRCDWFTLLRSYRDCSIHYGGTVSVYQPDRGILFQIQDKKHRNLITDDIVMFNDNVARFDCYVAWHVGYLLGLLEDVAQAMFRNTGIKNIVKSKSSMPALGMVKEWIEDLLRKHPGV